MTSVSTLLRRLGGVAAPALLIAAIPATAAADGVNLPTDKIAHEGTVRTDNGKRLVGRMAPNTQSEKVTRFRSGTKVGIVCQTRGETVKGKYGTRDLWNLVDIGAGHGVYVTDTYVFTGSNEMVAPDCGSLGQPGNVKPGNDKPSNPPPPPSGGPGWTSPVPSNGRVNAGMRYPSGGVHNAYDFGGPRRGVSFPVVSACNGTVEHVKITDYPNDNTRHLPRKSRTGTTNYVWIKCGDMSFGYAHFRNRDRPSWLTKGATVRTGQQLFMSGNQGNSTGNHLHFEARRGGPRGRTLNPYTYLVDRGVRNLPRR